MALKFAAGLFAPALFMSGFMSGCGPDAVIEAEAQAQDHAMVAPAVEEALYSAAGTLTAIENGSVTIDHAPIADLGWPSMMMEFGPADAALTEGLAPGMAVEFSFRRDGNRNVVTAIAPLP